MNCKVEMALTLCVLAVFSLSGCMVASGRKESSIASDCAGLTIGPGSGAGAQDFCGYFLDRYPFYFLYDSEDSYRSKDFERAVTVRYSDCLIASGAEKIEMFNGKLVKVNGEFHPDSYETQGLARGRIDGVKRIESSSFELSCHANKMIVKRR